jgi:hypothetical protein
MTMHGFTLALLIAVASAALPSDALAATAAPAPKAVETISWTLLPGLAQDLSAASDGTLFAVDAKSQVWQRPPGADTSWRSLPGKFQRISAARASLAWAIDGQGALYRYNGSLWRSAKARYPIQSADVGVSGRGIAFAVSTTGKLYALDERRGAVAIAGAPEHLRRIAVDDQNHAWVVTESLQLHRFDGKRWRQVAGVEVRDVAAGNGGIWAIGSDGGLLSLRADGTRPTPVPVRAAVVAIAPGGKPWIATADGHVYAQQPNTSGHTTLPAVEPEQVFTQLINWQPVIGSARQIAISSKGAILALGDTGTLWQWKGRNQWGRLPGNFSHVALDASNTPWALNSDGNILRFQGTFWTELPGHARDIAAGADGSVWILPPKGAPARWIADSKTWRSLQAAPQGNTQRIAVAPDGNPWTIQEGGKVARYDGKQWVDVSTPSAASIGIGPEGTVFITSADQRLWGWDRAGARWDKRNGEAASVAVGPGGQPWVTTASFRILASAFFDELPDSRVDTVSVATASAVANAAGTGSANTASVVGQPSAGGGAPQGNPAAPLQYRLLPGTARDIAIGADGSVYIIAYDGGLARWSNGRNAFISFEGQFSRIAVASDGKPWGVTVKGEVFRNDGTLWHLVRNISAQDIAIAGDGTVMVADTQNSIQRYDPNTGLFSRLPSEGDAPPPMGTHLALDPKGAPWTLDTQGYVSRCDRSPCERLSVRARDIDIGPEGSVIILDTNRVVRRWSESAKEFQRIDSITDTVNSLAVGPRGKPWLLSAGSKVWASELFARDESNDGTAAAATAATTQAAQNSGTATPPVFTFLVNMVFDQVSAPSFSSSSWPKIQMAINTSGSVVIADSSYLFWNYNESTKQLVKDTTVPALPELFDEDSMRSFVIGKDGTYWVSNVGSGPEPEVYRRQGNAWVSVPGLADCTQPSCLYKAMTLALGKDGTVYASSTAGKIYRYDTGIKRFVPTGIALPGGVARLDYIGIAPNGNFWAVHGDTGKIYERVGNTWTVRNGGPLTDASYCIDGDSVCVSIGANGSVYSTNGSNKLLRWNSSSWEVITTSPTAEAFVVAPDGRPWVVQSSPTKLFKAR